LGAKLDVTVSPLSPFLIISLRRERDEKAVPWQQVRAELLRDLEP
jgi:hypothetical protein